MVFTTASVNVARSLRLVRPRYSNPKYVIGTAITKKPTRETKKLVIKFSNSEWCFMCMSLGVTQYPDNQDTQLFTFIILSRSGQSIPQRQETPRPNTRCHSDRALCILPHRRNIYKLGICVRPHCGLRD